MQDPRTTRTPINEFRVNDEVDDLDFSFCGTTLASVSGKETLLWDIQSGRKIELPTSSKIGDKFKVRTIRFTTLGRKHIVFAAAYQQLQRTSKSSSFVALWLFNRESRTFSLANLRELKNSVSYFGIILVGSQQIYVFSVLGD